MVFDAESERRRPGWRQGGRRDVMRAAGRLWRGVLLRSSWLLALSLRLPWHTDVHGSRGSGLVRHHRARRERADAGIARARHCADAVVRGDVALRAAAYWRRARPLMAAALRPPRRPLEPRDLTLRCALRRGALRPGRRPGGAGARDPGAGRVTDPAPLGARLLRCQGPRKPSATSPARRAAHRRRGQRRPVADR